MPEDRHGMPRLRTWYFLPLPCPRTKVLVTGNTFPHRSLGSISSRTDNGVAPVFGHRAARKQDAEEKDDVANRKTNIHGCGSDIIVLHPPSTVGVADPLVEDITDGAPGQLCSCQ